MDRHVPVPPPRHAHPPVDGATLPLLDGVLLLLHADATGRRLLSDRGWVPVTMGVAIVELVAAQVLALEEVPGRPLDRIVRATGRPPHDPDLHALVAAVADRRFDTAARRVEGLLPGMRGIAEPLLEHRLERLARAGLLSPAERRVLGVVVDVDWLPGPRHEVERRLRDRLVGVVAGTARLDEEAALLLCILHPTGALPAILPELDRRLVVDRVGALVGGSWLAQAVFRLSHPGRSRQDAWLLR